MSGRNGSLLGRRPLLEAQNECALSRMLAAPAAEMPGMLVRLGPAPQLRRARTERGGELGGRLVAIAGRRSHSLADCFDSFAAIDAGPIGKARRLVAGFAA